MGASPLLFEKLGLISILSEFSRWLPVTIQGVGIREGVAAFGFELLGFSGEAGFLVCAVAYLINSFALVSLGILGMLILNYPAVFSLKKKVSPV